MSFCCELTKYQEIHAATVEFDAGTGDLFSS